MTWRLIPCDAFILKGRAPQAEVCVNSAYRKVKGVTASVTERKLIWDFLTWVSQAGAAKQSQAGVCVCCLSAAERVVCVCLETPCLKQSAKQLKTWPRRWVCFMWPTCPVKSTTRAGKHLCKNEFPSLVRLDGGNHAATWAKIPEHLWTAGVQTYPFFQPCFLPFQARFIHAVSQLKVLLAKTHLRAMSSLMRLSLWLLSMNTWPLEGDRPLPRLLNCSTVVQV